MDLGDLALLVLIPAAICTLLVKRKQKQNRRG
jgi:hypothetical protein